MTGTELFAAEIGDPEATRTVIAIVALLCVMGIALIMLALWLRRVTRPDPELLAPLELMGERSWRRSDPVGQRRHLDEVRPDGAEPLTRAAAPPKLDAAFDEGPSAPGFDDLRSNGPDPVELSGGNEGAERSTPMPPEGTPTPDEARSGTAVDATEVAVADRPEPSDDAAVDEVEPVVGAAEVTAIDEPVDVDGPMPADGDEAGRAVDADEREQDPVDGIALDGEDRLSSQTPTATNRPALDDLFAILTDGDIDPEALARARAELDAELPQSGQDT